MRVERLFVIIRSIGVDLSDTDQEDLCADPWTVAVFEDLETATKCYDENAYVVRNAPGEGPSDDMTIVTGCALYAVDTADRAAAVEMVQQGRGILLEAEEWPIDP